MNNWRDYLAEVEPPRRVNGEVYTEAKPEAPEHPIVIKAMEYVALHGKRSAAEKLGTIEEWTAGFVREVGMNPDEYMTALHRGEFTAKAKPSPQESVRKIQDALKRFVSGFELPDEDRAAKWAAEFGADFVVGIVQELGASLDGKTPNYLHAILRDRKRHPRPVAVRRGPQQAQRPGPPTRPMTFDADEQILLDRLRNREQSKSSRGGVA
ncbi:MAG: hypothetical protein ACRD2J_00200 [Thermoanaerobaculia bacterium]